MVKVKSLSYKDLILSPSGMTKKQPTFEPSPHCCAKTSLLFSSPSLSVWYVEDCFLLSDNADAPDIFEPAPFEIDDTDTRNTVKKYRRHGTKCTSVYILYLRVCSANTLLHGNTALHGGSNTSRIYFSSGKDAAGLNRSDVSASAETRCQKCTRMYTFGKATQ